MPTESISYNNEFLDLYMSLVEETESPRVFHLWSALTGIAACMGRRYWIPFGPTPKLFPNMFVLMVGTAASRKSTAMLIVKRLIEDSTDVRFAADDTAGKRQGFIAKMMDEEFNDVDDIAGQLRGQLLHDTEALARVQIDLSNDGRAAIAEPDKHVLFVCSTEFTNFTGHGNSEFLTFLNGMYDGDSYDYKLSKQEVKITDALTTILGCTTSVQIAEAFPKIAIGQGFTSRLILVYGGKTHQDIAWPDPLNSKLAEEVKKRFAEIYYHPGWQFTLSPDAKTYSTQLYKQKLDLNDGRFTYYLARRFTHLIKLAMVMAASRLASVLEVDDFIAADGLLKATEKTMPDALGEYGMSPIAQAKQQIVEYIQYANEPITLDLLVAFLHRDLRHQDIVQCVNDLTEAGKIQCVTRAIDNKICYIPRSNINPDKLQLMEAMTTAPTTEILQ